MDIQSAAHYRWGEGADGWHLLDSDQLSVIQECVPPGLGETPHLHQSAHQFFYLLAGEAELEIAGDRFKLEAGQGIHVPPGTVHRFHNPTEQPVSFLVVSSPHAHADRVETPA